LQRSQITLEKLIRKVSPELTEIFSEIRERILGISDAVREKLGGWYVDYRTASTFASVNVQKNRLKIFIKMGDQKLNDPRNICKPVPSTYGYGLLNTQFVLSKKEDIDYSMELIKQAYNFVTG
jgi:predicted transport protein